MQVLREGRKATVLVTGRIDAYSAPEFAEGLWVAAEGTEDLTLDFADLEYISSSGLRAVMLAIKTMAKQGEMRITHVKASVYETLEATGFTGVCDVETAGD